MASALYAQNNWHASLVDFRYKMNSEDKSHSHEAAMTVAQWYEQRGKTDKVEQVLQTVTVNKGTHRRAAKRMMRQMKNAEE